MTKNHGGGIIGGAIIEKRSLRRNHWKENHREEIIEQRGIWEASGRHLAGIWEASGRHLGVIREASGRHPGDLGSQGAPNVIRAVRALKSVTPLRDNHFFEAKHKLNGVFLRVRRPGIVIYINLAEEPCKPAATYHHRPLYQHRQNPFSVNTVWGNTLNY